MPSRRSGEDSASLASAPSTCRPASRAVTPLRRVEPRLHLVHDALLLVERHQPDAERERRRLAVRRDHRLREVGRHRVEQRAHGLRGPWSRLSERNRSGSDSAGHSAALPASVLGRVAVALEQPGLVVAHPLHDGGIGEVGALDHDVDLPRHAGRALQRVEVARAAQVLRHELAQVGADLRLRVDREPGQRDHEPDQQHPPRALERAAQHRLRHAPDEPPQRSRHAAHARAEVVDQLRRAARRARQRARAPAPPRRAHERRGAGAEREEERDRDAGHEQHAEPAHHRHRREQQHEEADRRREPGRGDRRHRHARRARGRLRRVLGACAPAPPPRRAPGTGSRSRPRARAAPAGPRSRPS